jgi:hypothetical protein
MRDAGAMEIEILLVPDCPNEKPAAERLRSALDGMGLSHTTFTTRVVADQAEAERLGCTGSPTILVNGRDQVRRYPGRHRHITLAMAAHACLTVLRARALDTGDTGKAGTDPPSSWPSC